MDNQEVIDHLHQIVEISRDSILKQKSINKEINDLYITAFYSTIVDYAQSIVGSLKTDDLIGIPPAFRSLFEAHIDLLNLCKYEKYHKVLYSIHLWERINMLEATFKNPENPYFKDTIENIDDRGNVINEYREELDSLKKEISHFEGNLRQIKTRFKLADLEEVYHGIYKVLCQDSHNDLLRLENRHFTKGEDGLIISMKTNWDFYDVSPHILTTISILKMSLEKVFSEFQYGDPKQYLDQIDSHYQSLKNIFDK